MKEERVKQGARMAVPLPPGSTLSACKWRGLHSQVALFLEMLDHCLKKNGESLLLTQCFMIYNLKGEKTTWIHFIPVCPAAVGIEQLPRRIFSPLPPGNPVKASKQLTRSRSARVAHCALQFLKSCYARFTFGLFSLPHVRRHWRLMSHPGREAEWWCLTLDGGICNHTTLLTHMWLTLG